MTTRISRRGLLAGIGGLTLMPQGVLSNPPLTSIAPLGRPIGLAARAGGGLAGVIARANLPGEVVCAVAEVKSGMRLEAHGGTTGLPPASVGKALTALYALETLGAGHRFETGLWAKGDVSGGVLKGDLILRGGGDPTLDTDDLARLAAGLKASGIREVRGRFVVDASILPNVFSIDRGQPDHLGYSPSVSGIALNYNRVHFEWKQAGAQYRVTMDARTEKYRPEVDMARMQVMARDLPVYTYADKGGVDHWTVARGALGKGGARWLPVRKPEAYVADVFVTLARSHGIVLSKTGFGPVPAAARKLVGHQSPPLAEILNGMLKYSNNLTAEMVGMMASATRERRPKDLADSAGMMSQWAAARFGMVGTRMVDHSGLGDASRMTPDDLVSALVQVGRAGHLRSLMKTFPLRDAKGRINKNHPIKVDAKTGTLNFVSGLGGFMTSGDGTELAFAIFMADTKTRKRIPRSERERPAGAKTWNRKAKKMQQALIERWGAVYGS